MSQSAALGDDVPRLIGGYELLAPIGEGGMGRVFLGRRQVVGGVVRRYAIKLLHSNLRADDVVAQQLLDEAKLAAHIAHPNVVQVIAGGEDGGHVFVAMEYVEGVTLARLVRHAIEQGRPIPLGIVASVLSDALAGLHAAHQARDDDGTPLNIVHRDFSPQNILVGADGIAKLTDFGIAKAISRIGGTATGIVKGKVSYLSPEQAMGHGLDQRSDVWAAGVVLWEALARERLFNQPTDTAALLAIVSGPRLRKPSSVWPEVPPAVDEVVLNALERTREARIRDAEELRQRLVQAVNIEHRVAHHVEVAQYVSPLIEARRVEVEAQIAETTGRDEPSGQTSVVRARPRGRLVTLPLDEAPDSDADETITDVASRDSVTRLNDGSPPSERSRDSVPTFNEAAASNPGAAAPLSSPGDVAPLSTPGAVASSPGPASAREPMVTRSEGPDSRASWPTAADARPAVGAAPPGRRTIATMWAAAFAVAGIATAVLLVSKGDLREARPGIRIPQVQVPVVAAEVRVTADEPIAQLSLGDDNRLIPEPRESITVPLPDIADGEELEVVAVAADRRRASGTLQAGQTEIELTFPEVIEMDDEAGEGGADAEPDDKAPPAPVRPVYRPRVSKKSSGKKKGGKKKAAKKPDGPGLGPSPYQK